jgi:Cu-Zn family superoxide dismutase
MLRSMLALTCVAVIATSGCAVLNKTKTDPYPIELAPTAGSAASGTLSAKAVPGGVHLQGRIVGLVPGSAHGFHIHQHGDCSGAGTPGMHFNPTGTEHGDPAGMIHHAGDLPNLTADAQGNVALDMTVRGVSLDTGTSDDVLGHSLVLDRDPDDFATQPDGNTGAYIACGVILKKE